jgi:hypothetical protein
MTKTTTISQTKIDKALTIRAEYLALGRALRAEYKVIRSKLNEPGMTDYMDRKISAQLDPIEKQMRKLERQLVQAFLR